MLLDDAVSVLLRAGHESFPLVTGSRGRSALAGMLLGSVSLAVAARAVCPVVVVSGRERNRQGSFGRGVVGVGDSTESAAGVPFAFREAGSADAPSMPYGAWRLPAHEHVDHPLVVDDDARAHEERASTLLTDALRDAVWDHLQVDVHQQSVEGPAHEVLLEASADANLIMVSALRRHGHFGLPLGRVAHALLLAPRAWWPSSRSETELRWL